MQILSNFTFLESTNSDPTELNDVANLLLLPLGPRMLVNYIYNMYGLFVFSFFIFGFSFLLQVYLFYFSYVILLVRS